MSQVNFDDVVNACISEYAGQCKNSLCAVNEMKAFDVMIQKVLRIDIKLSKNDLISLANIVTSYNLTKSDTSLSLVKEAIYHLCEILNTDLISDSVQSSNTQMKLPVPESNYKDAETRVRWYINNFAPISPAPDDMSPEMKTFVDLWSVLNPSHTLPYEDTEEIRSSISANACHCPDVIARELDSQCKCAIYVLSIIYEQEKRYINGSPIGRINIPDLFKSEVSDPQSIVDKWIRLCSPMYVDDVFSDSEYQTFCVLYKYLERDGTVLHEKDVTGLADTICDVPFDTCSKYYRSKVPQAIYVMALTLCEVDLSNIESCQSKHGIALKGKTARDAGTPKFSVMCEIC